MEKIITTILSTIIFSILIFSFVVPLYRIFALEDFTANPTAVVSDSNVQGTHDDQNTIPVNEMGTLVGGGVEDHNTLGQQSNSADQPIQSEQQPNDNMQFKEQATSPHPSANSIDTKPPKKVSGLSVKSQSNTELKLKWSTNKESDLNHYNVYMGTKSSFKVSLGVTPPQGTSTTNSFSSTGLKPSTKYYYKVAAVDDSGNIGSLSKSKSGKTQSGPTSSQDNPPKQVTGLSISSVSSSQLNLKWTANTESDFSHYNIYMGTESSFNVSPGKSQPHGTAATNSFSSTGLSPSTSYYYKVAAVDKAGNIGSLSTTKSGKTQSSGTGSGSDTTPPAQVSGLTASAQSSTQINLAWNSNGESDFDHYNIYRGTSSGFSVNLGVTQPAGTSKANSYSSTGLSPSTTYYYKVAAVDNAGNIGSLSSERSATTTSGSTGQAKAGIYVPLFTYPTDSSWTAVVNAKNAHPSVPFLVTINPSSGVGSSQDGNFVSGINKLKNAGITVIGYVYTSYGDRSTSTVNSEIDKYKTWYNVDGVFFDEMTNALGREQYYSDITAHAKSKGMTITVGNPGTDTRPSYIGTVDTMMTYESKGLPSDSQLKGSNNWHLNYDKRNFSIIPYGVPSLDPAYVSNAAQYVGWIYITNDDLPNPWNSIPSYFDSLISAVD